MLSLWGIPHFKESEVKMQNEKPKRTRRKANPEALISMLVELAQSWRQCAEIMEADPTHRNAVKVYRECAQELDSLRTESRLPE